LRDNNFAKHEIEESLSQIEPEKQKRQMIKKTKSISRLLVRLID
jgi:hypothetical protein